MRKTAPFLVLLVALTACRSSRAPVPQEDKPKRDYYSLNRRSLAFLKDSARQGREMRRENWRNDVAFRSRAPAAKRQRKLGRQYAVDSFVTGSRRETRDMWQGFKRELKWPDDFWAQARFGLLDSGD